MNDILKCITHYFRVFFIIAVWVWFLFPNFWALFNPYLWALIFFVTFLSSLKINFKELDHFSKNRKILLRFLFISMVVAPTFVYYITNIVEPDRAIWAMLLAAAPWWISCIAFADMIKANTTLSIILTVSSSLLCPFSITLLSYLFWEWIPFSDLLSLFSSLIVRVCIPIILALLAKKHTTLADRLDPYISSIAILTVMPAIWWPIWANIEYFTSLTVQEFLILNIFTFTLSIILHGIGRVTLKWQPLETKATWSLSMGYMNLAIATIVALQYFWPEAVLVVLMFELPWDLMLLPFSSFINRIKE